MEINPVLQVYKANQNNTVMSFQIYKNISNSNKRARALQKKGTSKARQLYHRWQQRSHYTFKCQVETMNQKERTSWISSIGFTPNGLAIDDNGLCFQRMKWRPKIHHSLKKKTIQIMLSWGGWVYISTVFSETFYGALPKFLSKLYKTKYHKN